jgi:Xaa-Pro aminopeptidase
VEKTLRQCTWLHEKPHLSRTVARQTSARLLPYGGAACACSTRIAPAARRYTQCVRRQLLLIALLVSPFVLSLPAAAPPPRTIPAKEFAERREKLRKSIPDGVFVLFGAKESEDLHYAFFQDTNFLYLTGWEEPGAILVITPTPDKDEPGGAERSKAPREILFLPQRLVGGEKWTGRKLGPDDPNAPGTTGFATIMPAERFESELKTLLEVYPNLYAVTSDPASAILQKIAPLRTVLDTKQALGRLRMEKSEAEIALIQTATDASVRAHRAAWQMIAPGDYEYEIAAVMVGSYLREGCRRSSYSPIVGSGPNSVTLHYSRNSRQMDAGEVVVMDVAAECANYASDITRTLPANGKFSPRQREIYEIVLGAQKAAIAAIRPGMTLARTTPDSLYKIAFDYINTHGKDLHGEPLGKYFTHGLGHHVGLDVHDESETTDPLKAGMVVTMEPGIYIPEENIGVRIEDVILVTATGSKVMSADLPTDPDLIEHELAGRRK